MPPTIIGVVGGYFARKAAVAAACAAGSALPPPRPPRPRPAAPGGGGRNPAIGPWPPWPGTTLRERRGPIGTAVLPLGRARNLGDHLACLHVVLPDRVLPEVREPLAVGVHAVPLRRDERADDVAVRVEVNHRGRPHAAFGKRRRRLGAELEVRQVIRPVVDPDAVVRHDRDPHDAADLPFVRKRPWETRGRTCSAARCCFGPWFPPAGTTRRGPPRVPLRRFLLVSAVS